MNIGMIGVGLMGHGIATNLQKHGHRLCLLEHAGNQPLETLLAGGATTRATPRDVAAESDLVILCVTGTPQVEAVVLGANGVLEGLRRDEIVIDCSTAVPTSTQRVAAAGFTPASGSQAPSGATMRIPGGVAAKTDSSSIKGHSPEAIDNIAKQLALYVGPIARVLVKKAAKQCANTRDIYDAVATEIESLPDRQKFLAQKPRH